LNSNGGRKCSGVMVTASSTAATSLRGGTKGACKHVNTPTLKSVMELRKECVRSVVQSDVYFESEASSPLYKRALAITVSGICSA
jgi:hypothetical protein